MTLIKTSLLNAIAVVIKLLTLLGINKVLAIYIGPTGYAALGQFQNAIQMITTFASGAVNTGVTKYTAEYYEDEKKQILVWRTAGTIVFIGSLSTSILIFIFKDFLSEWFLGSNEYSGVFGWFAVGLLFFVFNALLLAILNGKKAIGLYVVANISGSIFALLVTTILTLQFGLYGALVALVVYQSLSFVVTISLCYKTAWFKVEYLFGGVDKKTVRNLSKFAVMALTSAVCMPLSQILVRNNLGESFGWEAAGYWEAMWRLSAAYLMLVTTTLSVYYLPRLSEIKEAKEIKTEILQGYKIILPFAVLLSSLIYILRDVLITVLFSESFMPMRSLFAWQLVGDSLKIASWIIAYLMLGKAMFKLFIVSEIMFSFSFVVLTRLCTSIVGFEGVAIAHALNYLVYWVFVGMLVSLNLSRIKKNR